MMPRLMLVSAVSMLAACTAYRLPDVPDDEHPSPTSTLGIVRLEITADPKMASPHQLADFHARFREDLTNTGLFEAVVPEDDDTASLVVRPEVSVRHCFSEPMITVLTLGIIPSPSCYRSGYRFTLGGTSVPNGSVVVDDRSQPRTLWGWIAGPVSLLPGWSPSPPRSQEVQALRVAILRALGRGRNAPD